MNNLIVVPTEIKFGLYSIKVIEVGDQLIGICGNCHEELQAGTITQACESKWIFCSDDCADLYIKCHYDPDGDNEGI